MNIREFLLRAVATFLPGRRDGDLERELRAHLELAADEARGELPEEAERAAAIRSGGLAHAMDALRDQRGLPWLDDLARDIRHGVRLLRRAPGFAAIAVISLGLGIGLNAAIFSLTDALLLRPLPVRSPGAILTISADTPDESFYSGGQWSYPNYRDISAQARSFDGVVASRLLSLSFARTRDGVREMRLAMMVSGNFFDVLGVPPALGRTFVPSEGTVPGRDAVVVLAYDFWKNDLAGDRSILDGMLWINGVDFHVIGVAAPSFTTIIPPVRPAFYVPAMMAARLLPAGRNPLEDRDARPFRVKARLASGVSRERARAELATIWQGLQRLYPDATRNRTIAVRTEVEERIHSDPWDANIMGLLMALVSVVLVIACANVANLMLGRVRARSREIGIRLALGISRTRLLRQLLAESLVLASIGLVVGLVVAYGGILFLWTIPVNDQIVLGPELDQRVLAFSVLAAAASVLLFGIAPARQCLKTDVVPALKALEPEKTARQRTLGRNALVVAQVALSLVLLIATGMLYDGFRKAITLDPGFRTDRLMTMSLDTSLVQYTAAQTHAFYRDLVARVQTLPGVASATLTSAVPLDVGSQETRAFTPDGYQLPPGQETVSLFSSIVDDRYFQTMQIAMISGRPFTAADDDRSRPVVIVNEEFAKTYWPGQGPIGKRLKLADKNSRWLEVVGVARTGKYTWVAEAPMPFVYLPFAQHEQPDMAILVETASADPASIASPLREIVRSLDVNQPVFKMRSYARLYTERTVAVPLIIMQLVGAMGLLGLTLALIGLYGLVAYSVARRTREIGIRMAVGAGKTDVLGMVLRQALTLAAAGIAVGGVASLAVARLLTSALVGIGTPNPATYVIVPAALVCLTIAASYFPARRASLVDPLIALRCD